MMGKGDGAPLSSFFEGGREAARWMGRREEGSSRCRTVSSVVDLREKASVKWIGGGHKGAAFVIVFLMI
jgi:hypothetical protein